MGTFKFDKDCIKRHIRYDLKLFSKMREPIAYVIDMLEKKGHSLTIKSLDKFSLNKVEEKEGKNYHWSVIKYNNISLLIRRYGQHLTIFSKVERTDRDYDKIQISAFTFHSDRDKFPDKNHDKMMDERYSKPFMDLQVCFPKLMELLSDDYGAQSLWNDHSFPRPEFVEVKEAFCNTEISSIDLFVFCMEELDQIHLTLFAENDMVEKLKEFKAGDVLNERYTIKRVASDVNDDYYHSTGLTLKEKGSKGDKWEDVYSLTRWFYEDIFKTAK